METIITIIGAIYLMVSKKTPIKDAHKESQLWYNAAYVITKFEEIEIGPLYSLKKKAALLKIYLHYIRPRVIEINEEKSELSPEANISCKYKAPRSEKLKKFINDL